METKGIFLSPRLCVSARESFFGSLRESILSELCRVPKVRLSLATYTCLVKKFCFSNQEPVTNHLWPTSA
jgi:hypothetical protein